jgi:hypothetical protein
MASSIDSSSLEVLKRAKAWLDRFHETAADTSGDRLRHFKQRRCVERNNCWDGASNSFLDWEELQKKFCQQALDAETELEMLLPILRPLVPDAATVLEGVPPILEDLRTAIVDIRQTDTTGKSCRRWFKQQQEHFHRLKSEDVSAVACRGCDKYFRDADEFEEHFKHHPTELRHRG